MNEEAASNQFEILLKMLPLATVLRYATAKANLQLLEDEVYGGCEAKTMLDQESRKTVRA